MGENTSVFKDIPIRVDGAFAFVFVFVLFHIREIPFLLEYSFCVVLGKKLTFPLLCPA